MEELMVPNTGAKFQSKALTKATNSILSLIDRVKEHAWQIAYYVAQVDKSKSYEEDGFANVHEWTAKAFGWAKSQSYNFLALGRDYLTDIVDKNGKVIGHECVLDRDFTTSQVIKMLPLGKETAEQAVEAGAITADMSAREIERKVKELRTGKQDSIKEETSREEDTEEPETEEDTEEPETEGEETDSTENQTAHIEYTIVVDETGNRYQIPADVLKLYLIKE